MEAKVALISVTSRCHRKSGKGATELVSAGDCVREIIHIDLRIKVKKCGGYIGDVKRNNIVVVNFFSVDKGPERVIEFSFCEYVPREPTGIIPATEIAKISRICLKFLTITSETLLA